MKVVNVALEPGQNMEDLLEEILQQEMERTKLAAEEAALRSGKSAEEAHRKAEEWATSYKPVALAADNTEGIMDVLQQVLSSLTNDPEGFPSNIATDTGDDLGAEDGGQGDSAAGEPGGHSHRRREVEEESSGSEGQNPEL
mmetsp:Transcript_1833/g.5326  ORF Transcript_1833/g.5326 Transcript_1833/m.5326 type:complete len:141 (-) Transcript_1833:544-966(-)